MARKSVFPYTVKRGIAGTWVVVVKDNTPDRAVYRVQRGVNSGTWYVKPELGSIVFNAGTLRDCIVWILAYEEVL